MDGPLVIGFGVAGRGDDAAGPLALERLRALAPEGVRVASLHAVPADLFAWWGPGSRVVLIDATRGGAPPGTVRRVDALAPLPLDLLAASERAGDLADAVAVARALGCLPGSLVVLAVEGQAFARGPASAAVARAADEVARRALEELMAPRAGGAGATLVAGRG